MRQDILSLWRSPLDTVALNAATALPARDPRCSIMFDTSFYAMTIYNYGSYVGTEGAGAGTNSTALAGMFSAMSVAPNGTGGVAFIPQVAFPINSSSSGFVVPDQCTIVGSGGGGSESNFYHFEIQGTGETGGPGNVLFSCAGDYTAGGKYFRSLAFSWAGTSSNHGDTCIAAGTFNCRAVSCTFTDCPLAFYVTGESCALEKCTIDYSNGPNGATAVVVAGPRFTILGPGELQQRAPSKGGPMMCTCVSIENKADHTVIANSHFVYWNIGVDFSQQAGSTSTEIRNCEALCEQNSLNIALPVGASIATCGVKVLSCTLAKAHDSSLANPVVNIGTLGSSNNGLLYDIMLVDCTVFSQAMTPQLNQHGVEIASGSNIKIIGGTYSNNSPNGGAGIAITGSCGDVQIIGANLQPSYPNVGSVYLNNQEFALLVSGNPVGPILVSACDMSGYSGAPVSVTGNPSELLILNCVGYNDKNTSLSATSVMLTSGVSAAKTSFPYFGPSVITFSNSTPLTVQVFGQSLTMSFGVIFLPNPYDTIRFSEAPSTFSWTGK